jgi:hypothetical protein
MNQYGSTVRTFRARNLFETTITPPNDLTVASATCKRQVLNREQYQLNIQSNLIIKRLGVFCNFADGLVFKSSAWPLNVSMFATVYQRTLVAGSFNVTAGSKAVTGVGLSAFADQDRILLYCGASPLTRQYFIVDGTPASDNAMTLTDYSDITAVNPGLMYKMTAIVGTSGGTLNFPSIRELNYMYEVDQFWSPLLLGSPLMTDMLITVLLNNGLTKQFDSSDTPFLTKSVDTSFAASAVAFDVVADVEYTPA